MLLLESLTHSRLLMTFLMLVVRRRIAGMRMGLRVFGLMITILDLLFRMRLRRLLPGLGESSLLRPSSG
jgi:hypothetical protein